jgi:hypothetical protein
VAGLVWVPENGSGKQRGRVAYIGLLRVRPTLARVTRREKEDGAFKVVFKP